jgi:hypothetical protein
VAFHASKENFHRRFQPLLLGVEGIECVHQTAVFFRFGPQSSLDVLVERHRHSPKTIAITTVAIIITIAIIAITIVAIAITSIIIITIAITIITTTTAHRRSWRAFLLRACVIRAFLLRACVIRRL